MKIFTSLFALVLTVSQLHGQAQQPALPQSAGCKCCCIEDCERPITQTVITSTPADAEKARQQEANRRNELIAKINRIYQAPGPRAPELKKLEQQLLKYKGYFRCEICRNVVGPGVHHGYRHPVMILSNEDLIENLDRLDKEPSSAAVRVPTATE